MSKRSGLPRSGPAIDGSTRGIPRFLMKSNPRLEPKFPLLVVGVSGPSPGEDVHGQANRRTAAAHLLGRVRRGHHVRRNPAPLEKQKHRWGRARGPCYKRRQHLEPNIDLMSRRRCGRAPFDFASKEFRANAREFLGGGLMGGGADGFENRGASRAGSQGGTVAPAGGNTCAPRSARLALKARGPGNTGPELLQPALRATSVGSC
jgi:hypothetical protein